MRRRPKQWGPLSPQEQRKVLQGEIADRKFATHHSCWPCWVMQARYTLISKVAP
jgi:hypothetical protein